MKPAAVDQLAAEGYPRTMLQADLCRLLNCHANTLYKRIKAGDVPAYVRVGSGPKARYEWDRTVVASWYARRAQSRRAA